MSRACSRAPNAPRRRSIGAAHSSPHSKARALVVNSGNANAFTGHRGFAAVAEIGQAVAKATGAAANEVYMASTGVIGEPLDPSRIVHALDQL